MKTVHVATYIALSFLTTNILKAAASDPALTDPTPATASVTAVGGVPIVPAGTVAGAEHSAEGGDAAAAAGTLAPATAAAVSGTAAGAGVDVRVLSRVIYGEVNLYAERSFAVLSRKIAATGFTLEGRAAPAARRAVATSFSGPDFPLIRAALEFVAAKGDKYAHNRLIDAAYEGKLDFTATTGRAYLESLAAAGDEDAQQKLNQAAYNCTFDFTPVTARKYLEDLVAAGNKSAQYWLNEAAYSGKLDFTDTTGYAYLDSLAAAGYIAANNKLVEAASRNKLGFTPETGREYLENRVAKGDKYAEMVLLDMNSLRRYYAESAGAGHSAGGDAAAGAGTLAPATAAAGSAAGAGARYSSAAGGAGASAAAGMTDLPTTVLLTPANLNDVGKMNKAIALTIDPKEGFKLLVGLIATYPAAIPNIYSIKCSSIGDGDLKHLERLTHLRELHLSFDNGLTNLTVLSGLKSKLPDLKIVLT